MYRKRYFISTYFGTSGDTVFGWPRKLAHQRDEVIDSIMFRASTVALHQSDSSDELAEEIARWAEEAA